MGYFYYPVIFDYPVVFSKPCDRIIEEAQYLFSIHSFHVYKGPPIKCVRSKLEPIGQPLPVRFLIWHTLLLPWAYVLYGCPHSLISLYPYTHTHTHKHTHAHTHAHTHKHTHAQTLLRCSTNITLCVVLYWGILLQLFESFLVKDLDLVRIPLSTAQHLDLDKRTARVCFHAFTGCFHAFTGCSETFSSPGK